MSLKRSQNSPEKPAPDSILVIKFRSIGDVVTMTPCLSALAGKFPAARIDVAVEKPQDEILRHNPHISSLVILSKKNRKGWSRVIEDIRYIRDIRKKRYDWVIDLHGGPRSAWITFFSGARKRIGSRLYRYRFPYTDVCSPYREEPPLGTYSIVETQLGILEKMNVAAENPGVEMFLSNADMESAEKIYTENSIHPGSDFVIVVQPTATGYNKRWHAEYWAEYLKKINRAYKPGWILTCGPGERGYIDDIIKKLDFPVVNLAEKTRLRTLAALIRRGDLFIGSDSGPGHIAAAVKTPAVIIFCSTFHEIWAPWGERVRVIRKELECSPCGRRRCITGTLDCVEKLSTEKAFEETRMFIDELVLPQKK